MAKEVVKVAERLKNRVVVTKGIVSIFIFGLAMWLYTSTAIPGLIVGGGVESESAQLQRVANRLGIAHSTGYPLHTLLGYAAARLADVFDQNPYTWITYTSALLSALGLVMFWHLLMEFAPAPNAFAGVLILMVSNAYWHVSTITETQALHAFCLIGLWWMTVRHVKNPQQFTPLVGMALFAGIGLANHRTIVFSIGAAALVVLLTGAWRKWSRRQWATLICLTLLPVLSYGYLFIRAQDDHVVFSTRPTWFPAEIDNAEVVDIIRGTLQGSGEGLEGNLVFPKEDRSARWEFVRTTLEHELSPVLIGFGLLGVGLLSVRSWRLGVAFGFYGVAWVLFLMSWRLDWKAVIYYHSLVMVIVMGLVALTTIPMIFVEADYKHPAVPTENLVNQKKRFWGSIFSGRLGIWGNKIRATPTLTLPHSNRGGNPPLQISLVVASLFALPLFYLAFWLYDANHDARDLSEDTRGIELYDAMASLPPNSYFYGGGWMPDTFILLEYLDNTDQQHIVPQDTLVAETVAQDAQDSTRTVIIGPSARGFFGLYSGSTFFHDRQLAFSGTTSPLFYQIRRPDDSRLLAEADSGTIVHAPMTPEIELYSYQMTKTHETLILTLYWQALSTTGAPYSVFTHLRDYDIPCQADTLRSLIAQDDSFGTVRNMHPTNWWQAGEIVKDTYFIPLPTQLIDSSRASVVIGMTLYGQPQGEFCLPYETK